MQESSNILMDNMAIIIVILFFGGSIFIHEFGHFLAAKWRGLKVLRFSIGFGPKIFGWRGKDGCEYRVSLLPLGGYVAIPQLADMGEIEGENEDDSEIEILKKLPQATFLDKVIISAAGAFFNVLLAIALATLVYFIGIPSTSESETNRIGFVLDTVAGNPSAAKKSNLKEGDAILEVDSQKVKNFAQIRQAVALGSGRDKDGNPQALLKIERDGKFLDVTVSPNLVETNVQTGDKLRMLGVYPASNMVIDKTIKNSPAEKAGLKSGDKIISINKNKVYSNLQFTRELNLLKENETANILVDRNNKEINISLVPKKVARTKPLCEIFESKNAKTPILTLLCTNENLTKSEGKNDEVGILKVLKKDKADEFLDDIKIGSILYQADGKDVSSVEALNTIVNFKSDKKHIILKFIDSDNMQELILNKGAISRIIESQKTSMAGYTIRQDKIVEHPSVLEQIENSWSITCNAIATLFNSKSDVGISHMSGPIGIGRAIYKISLIDIGLVLSFAVLLNINLAILNMLPIPVLDGGHILIAFIEKITGKFISKSTAIKVTQSIFALLFLSLMAYVIYLDTQRWRGENKEDDIYSLESQYYLNNISFDKNE